MAAARLRAGSSGRGLAVLGIVHRSPSLAVMRNASWSYLLTLVCVASTAAGQARAQGFDHHAVRGRLPVGGASERLEGEFLPMLGKSRLQDMRSFGPQWSGDAHLLWDGKVTERMTTSLPVERGGRHRLRLQLTTAPDYGRFAVWLDGQQLLEDVDLFTPRVELLATLDLGEHELARGEHELSFELLGANEQARAYAGDRYLLGLDYVELACLEPAPAAAAAPAGVEVTAAPAALSHLATWGEVRPLLERHCLRCHGGEGEVEGDVDLAALRSPAALREDPELLRALADVVTSAEMPPAEEPQPSRADRARLGAYFEDLVGEVAAAAQLAPVTMRRLTRYEYNNAVRDLLELDGDVFALPEKVVRGDAHFDPASGRMPRSVRVSNRTLGKNQIEQRILTGVDPYAIDLQSEHGFNNRGEELGMSTILLESLLKLGRSIPAAPEFDKYTRLFERFFQPGQESVSARLRPFLERAFRRPVDDETVARYAAFHAREWERQGSYTQAMKAVVGAVLASPKFCFVVERAPSPGAARAPLDDYELAQRLALFLWSSIPDAPLLAAARDGLLRSEKGLRAQVERMLLDKRCRALAENFARQWLRLDQLVTAVPDFDRFETYYARIGCEQWKFGLQSMIEPLLLFESILVEDRSVLLLVDSRYAYRSDELEAWYRRPEDPFHGRGNRDRFGTGALVFRRRVLPSRREGGVVTTAATLTMTSTPLRTSPIKRGAWVATVLLNDPPPPPPDAVPEIEADDEALAAAGLTIRERLALHATQQDCASCHARIDPLGFALENYDPVGRWRDVYRGGLPIDAGGVLFGEAEFATVEEFKDALLARPARFVRAFVEHLMSYALGRGLRVGDEPAVDRVVARALADGGRITTVLTEVALSHPFRNKAAQRAGRGASK